MRLLHCEPSDSLTGTYTISLMKHDAQNIPPYAILSHRWGDDEVTFNDIQDKTACRKGGYKKLEFCAEQASRDGLTHFWVDTCCIDKASSAELQEAVNSMFQWYNKANKCYVYLSDVLTGPKWQVDFERSEWFRRGWTLQELLAPANVEFFTLEGTKLGDKKSLEQEISAITGISIEALREEQFVQIDQGERFSWAAQRETTVEEDSAYCLLGIFGVHMSLIYGEGRQNALARLRRKIARLSQSDPSFAKGGPLTVHEAIARIKQANQGLVETLGDIVGNFEVEQVLAGLRKELNSINTLISNFGNSFRSKNEIVDARIALISVKDVIVIMTQSVLLCLKLYDSVQQRGEPRQSVQAISTRPWTSDIAALTRLLKQLQRHKSSWSLLLRFISCDSQSEAEHTADVLRRDIYLKLEKDIDLTERLEQLEQTFDKTFSNVDVDNHSPKLRVVAETSAHPGDLTMTPSTDSESFVSRGDMPDFDGKTYKSSNQVIASSRVYEGAQALEVDALTVTSSTGSHDWSMLSRVFSTRLSVTAAIYLPLHKSESQNFLELRSLQTVLSPSVRTERKSEAVLTYLEEHLRKFLLQPQVKMDMRTYMDVYNKVHFLCHSPPSPLDTSGVPYPYGGELYILLRACLSNHVKQIHAIAETYVDGSLLSFYTQEWEKYTEAAKVNSRVFRYLDRHWITRRRDEGMKDLNDVYTLHLVQWKCNFLDMVWERLLNTALQLISQLRDGKKIEQGQINILVASFISLGFHKDNPSSSSLDVYERYFEQPFLAATREYFQKESKLLSDEVSLVEYTEGMQKMLEEEKERAGLFLHPETMKKLVNVYNESMVVART